jgi:hypothetical protein
VSGRDAGEDVVVLARMLATAGVIASLSLGAADLAHARVVVAIDKSTQRMTVAVDGATRHVFTVSTGRAGFGTPNGHFRPQRLARTWFSKKYYNSPMPHSIFFHGGYAIHGSYEIRRLGGPASHGCVRLHPADAAALFALVKSEGTENTRIVVTGTNPAPARSRLLARNARERASVVAQPRVGAPIQRASLDRPDYRPRMHRPPMYRQPAYRPPQYRPPHRPSYRMPIYQDPKTGWLWSFGPGRSVRILAR